MKTARALAWAGMAVVAVAFAMARTSAAYDNDDATSAADTSRATSASLSEIRDRGETMPVDLRHDVEKRIRVTIERVNKEAAEKGQAAVAARLASEFGLTTDALLDQKGDRGLSWGELVIAYTLLANSKDKVTLPDLANLRSEGLSWGAIAFGLRFHLEDLEDAIKAEGRVAMGLSKPDGKPATIGK